MHDLRELNIEQVRLRRVVDAFAPAVFPVTVTKNTLIVFTVPSCYLPYTIPFIRSYYYRNLFIVYPIIIEQDTNKVRRNNEEDTDLVTG